MALDIAFENAYTDGMPTKKKSKAKPQQKLRDLKPKKDVKGGLRARDGSAEISRMRSPGD
jgi:hypothetical protein